METNKKHTPTPWSRIVLKTKQIAVAKFVEIDGKPAFEPIAQVDTNENAEFIVTACNSYQSLIEQTTKLQADKDKMAEQLNRELSFLQSEYKSADIKKLFAVGSFMHNRITKITETLSECGYNI